MKKSDTFKNINEIKWSLRAPVLVFLFGAMAALYQRFPTLYLGEKSLHFTLQYLGSVAVIFILLEMIGLNKKKVPFILGLFIMAFGFLLAITFK